MRGLNKNVAQFDTFYISVDSWRMDARAAAGGALLMPTNMFVSRVVRTKL